MLLGPACLRAFGLRLCLAAKPLEKLLNSVNVEVVVAHSPHEPVKVFFELEVFSGDDQAVEATGLHLSQSPGHLDLLLDPVAVVEKEDPDHEFNLAMHGDLLKMVHQLAGAFVFERSQVLATDVLLEAGHV